MSSANLPRRRLINSRYYNLATDFYEYGFGQSFHFSRAALGESFHQSIVRHEHYLAHKIDIKSGMKVLDVGCGVGGPAREIARFTGAYITGLNLNEYQVERATRYAAQQRLDKQVQFVQGNFMVRVTANQDLGLELTTSANRASPSRTRHLTRSTPSRQRSMPRRWKPSTRRFTVFSSQAELSVSTSGS
jgi:SAM-dependent methyltransferase